MAVAAMNTLPDHSRLWVFEADRELTDEEVALVRERTEAFLGKWTAHGSDLTAACDVRYSRFVFVAVDEESTGASGCSIDSLTRFVTDLGNALGVRLLDRDSVTYRAQDEIVRVTRNAFKQLAATGQVDDRTTVFDNTVTQLAAVRNGTWEVSAVRSWHAGFFRR